MSDRTAPPPSDGAPGEVPPASTGDPALTVSLGGALTPQPPAGTDPQPQPEAVQVPAPGSVRIPGYEVFGELGRGGMGVVYLARQVSLNRQVALKMILAGGYAGAQDRERFRKEAEAIARLRHPNIVQVYDVGEADGYSYFSMEHVEG